MSKKGHTWLGRYFWLVLIGIAGVLLGVSVLSKRGTDLSDLATRRFSWRVTERVNRLESYMDEVLALPRGVWPNLADLPEDMVIYRYDDDTLKAWCHQFSLDNDDVASDYRIERLTARRFNLVSPLRDVDTSLSYVNMGPQWYLVKMKEDGRGRRVYGGLQVRNTLDRRSYNGVNPRLKLSDRFAVYPVSTAGGATVSVEGIPLLKIIQENARVMPLVPDAGILWLSLLLVLTGLFFYLHRQGSLRDGYVCAAAMTFAMGLFYLLGRGMQGMSDLFSPTVYAGGPFLFSLGAVLIVNTWLTCLVICLSMVQLPLLRRLRAGGALPRRLFAGGLCLFIALLAYYIHATFRSIIANSNITLELYKIRDLSRFTAYVYFSYLCLMASIPLLLQILGRLLRKGKKRRIDVFSRTGRLLFAFLSTCYLLTASSVLGFRREASRADIWANRLAMDRNLGFELQLRRMERAIASDPVIPSLLAFDTDYRISLGRIMENYMHRLPQEYDISLYMFRDDDSDPGTLQYYNDRIRQGFALPDSSRFFYSRSGNGRARYTGVFAYYTPSIGVTTLLVGIDSNADKEGRGYTAALGDNRSGGLVLPRDYSYGKYLEDKLISYNGDYAYPTILSGRLKSLADEVEDSGQTSLDRYVHFLTRISDDECVIVSRPAEGLTQYMVAGLLIFLLSFFGINVPLLMRPRRSAFDRNYYKQRINILLFFSLVATLVAMAVISVLFVYRRNEANLQRLMTDRINTVQSLVEARSRSFTGPADFLSQEFSGILASIGDYTHSDITLYGTDGKVLRSTAPEFFERMVLGSRLDEDAFREIMFLNRRYFIHKEEVSGRSFYALYAPIFGTEGQMLAIVCAPYTDSGLEFREEAVFHAVFIITVFFLLLILTRFLSIKVTDKMFRPLVEMGGKMSAARTEGLEYIMYDREDEITALVRSYNLMVHDVSESSKQLAQVERDKAWSEMARQVAHEIKNPLTPIKLQIQRIIRLRERHAPDWEEKFDSIVPVIMDSIDSLTDTANEFSTFARLYSEEPVDIDLYRLVADQVALFDEKDNIHLEFIGLKDAVVSGPKPQLTRVIVNLLTNAVQAVENQQREEREAGRTPEMGQIHVSLRNSSRDGFYDIVVEDNGPGVRDENRSRLFTPNFTTKTGGTGLGLAICKNILERCGGEIFYARAFTLGGASFTVRFPKKK